MKSDSQAETTTLLAQFAALRRQLAQVEPSISDATTLGEIQALLGGDANTRATGSPKEQVLQILDRFLALKHHDQGEFEPLTDCKQQVRSFRQEVEASTGALSADAQDVAAGKHPVALMLKAIEEGDQLNDAQWSSMQNMLVRVFGSAVAVAVSRGKLYVAEQSSKDAATNQDVFLWGNSVPVQPKEEEPLIVFGAKSLGLEPMDNQLVPLKVGVHIQNIGDREFAAKEFAGTRGKSLAIEGLTLQFVTPIPGLTLEYTAHIAGKGDLPWVYAGQYAGTRGENRAVEGFAVRLSGVIAGQYDVFYSAHAQNVGDLPVQSNGEYCGTRGKGLRVEGLSVWVQKKA